MDVIYPEGSCGQSQRCRGSLHGLPEQDRRLPATRADNCGFIWLSVHLYACPSIHPSVHPSTHSEDINVICFLCLLPNKSLWENTENRKKKKSKLATQHLLWFSSPSLLPSLHPFFLCLCIYRDPRRYVTNQVSKISFPLYCG